MLRALGWVQVQASDSLCTGGSFLQVFSACSRKELCGDGNNEQLLSSSFCPSPFFPTTALILIWTERFAHVGTSAGIVAGGECEAPRGAFVSVSGDDVGVLQAEHLRLQ